MSSIVVLTHGRYEVFIMRMETDTYMVQAVYEGGEEDAEYAARLFAEAIRRAERKRKA